MKAYTDLEQSKKLAEILPLESADMWWAWYSSLFDNGHYDDFPMFYKPICNPNESIPCWSLAALLDVLSDYTLQTNTDGTVFVVCESKKSMISDAYNNPVDACYEMIIKLKEQKSIMKAYITKDKFDVVQLWNNKPEYNNVMECWQAWVKKGYVNEVAVDVTANNLFRESVIFENSPKIIEL